MNSIDIFIIIFSAILILRGFFRGFILELTTIIGLVLGYLLAITYLDALTLLIQSFFPNIATSIIHILSFSILFLCTNIVLRFIANAITKTLKFALLGWLNRLLGGLLGFMKSILVLSIFVFLLSLVPLSLTFMNSIGIENSILFPIFKSLGPELYKQIQKIANHI
jgi:membrane protein required for colicin V production